MVSAHLNIESDSSGWKRVRFQCIECKTRITFHRLYCQTAMLAKRSENWPCLWRNITHVFSLVTHSGASASSGEPVNSSTMARGQSGKLGASALIHKVYVPGLGSYVRSAASGGAYLGGQSDQADQREEESSLGYMLASRCKVPDSQTHQCPRKEFQEGIHCWYRHPGRCWQSRCQWVDIWEVGTLLSCVRARMAWWWLKLKAYVGSYAMHSERDDRER